MPSSGNTTPPPEPPPVHVRSAPVQEETTLLDEGDLAAAFLDQLESGSFEGFGDDLFADLAKLGSEPEARTSGAEDLLSAAGGDNPGDIAEDLFSMPTTYEVGRPGEVARSGHTDISALADLEDLFATTSAPGGSRATPTLDEDLFGSTSAPPASDSSHDSSPGRRKKPARLRISYSSAVAFGREYRENLRRGTTFIRSDAPLPPGRECVFDIRVPGVKDSLKLTALVVWSSRDRELPEGDEPGMRLEYRLTDEEREALEAVLTSLDT